jgi:hypothetical protein
MPGSRKPRRRQRSWGDKLGKPIEQIDGFYADARREQYNKMLLLKEHFKIQGERGWRPWYALALAIASELDDGLKIVDWVRKQGRTAPRWRGAEGIILLQHVEDFKNASNSKKLLGQLAYLQQLLPSIYGGMSRDALEKAYYEALRHHRRTPKPRQRKRAASE